MREQTIELLIPYFDPQVHDASDSGTGGNGFRLDVSQQE